MTIPLMRVLRSFEIFNMHVNYKNGASLTPKFSKINEKNRKKKGMGVSTSAHPCCQAFALPRVKDKQRSQPTPSEIIQTLVMHRTTKVYNTPT